VDWGFFKERFVSRDGRVVDVRQDKTSHSEGQGYAMLLAVKHDDGQAFARIWQWTRANIGVRQGDALLAWSWGRRPGGSWNVLDYNNAADGDILVAWALMLADRKWPERGYARAGQAIIQSVQEHLVLERGTTLHLLPGYYGFHQADSIVFNPSYWVFPAFDRFARLGGGTLWSRLERDALQTLSSLSFGHLGLPPDWALLEGDQLGIDETRSTRFGFEAVRIPLYLAWDGNKQALHQFDQAIAFFERLGYIPSFVDVTKDSVSLFPASGGVYAVFARACRELGRTELSRRWWQRAGEKVEKEKDDYYSVVLYLLAGLGFEE
jgi:endoglucanase